MSLKGKAFSGIIWTSLQQFGITGIRFIVQIILARLIAPEEFGLLGMILIFNVIGITLVDSGMGQSIIRTKDPDDDDYSSVFFMNMIVAVVIYALLFFTAPFISIFFEETQLTNLVRVYSLIILFSASYMIQVTRLTKKLNFKSQAFVELPALIIAAIIGIWMAFREFGVWSLVGMQVSNSFIILVQYWWRTKWIPKLKFNRDKWWYHFNFGYKLLFSSMLDTVYSNIYPMLIGKFYTAAQVGFYTRANTTQMLPVGVISSTFNKVLYPILSEIKDNPKKLVDAYRRILKLISLIICGILGILIIIAKPFFILLFTDIWLPAVPYFQILCVAGILYPLNMYYINSLKVTGRTDLFLKGAIFKKVLGFIILFLSLPYGIEVMLYGFVLSKIISLNVNQYLARKVIDYSFFKQNLDVIRILIPAGIALVVAFLFKPYVETYNYYLQILVLTFLFLIPFLFFEFIINKEVFKELMFIRKYIYKLRDKKALQPFRIVLHTIRRLSVKLGDYKRIKNAKGKTKIFCVGRNKTGTTSIKRALLDLGITVGNQREAELLNKEYHKKEFSKIIKYCKKNEAFQDAPFSWPDTYKHMYEAFPDSKFILTVRESPEVWYNSLVRFQTSLHGKGVLPTVDVLKEFDYVYKGWYWSNRVHVFGFTEEDDPYDKERWINHYLNYNQTIRDFFKDKPEQFLEIDVSKKGSYQKLCAFLGKEPLYDDFPWENKTKTTK